jgi:hypothetical protein
MRLECAAPFAGALQQKAVLGLGVMLKIFLSATKQTMRVMQAIRLDAEAAKDRNIHHG